MHSRFTVYETNSDLEPLHTRYTGESQDVAETVMLKAFPAESCLKDFMITRRAPNGDISLYALMLSDRSKRLRNEC